MKRITVIQRLLDAIGGQTYLEIGVAYGGTFLHVAVPRKIGVEPALSDPVLRPYFRRVSGLRPACYAEDSDGFFAAHQSLFSRDKIDVAFIDGFHSYRQSLRDVSNCLRVLDARGVIVLDDCNPRSEHLERPRRYPFTARAHRLRSVTTQWCGDVWKTIVHLRATRPNLQVCVLDCAHGIGIIRNARSDDQLPLSPAEIRGFTYTDLVRHRHRFLNLKPPSHLRTILRQL